MNSNASLVRKLTCEHLLTKEEYVYLMSTADEQTQAVLQREACSLRDSIYGRKVFFRGIIEFSNYCRNNCFYCGIRRGNSHVHRYRLAKEQILQCCKNGWQAGVRTFVLQGGEDAYFTDEKMADIIMAIKASFPDCAITLSIGERSEQSYIMLFNAGANRFLLREESANSIHYAKLHPPEQKCEIRKNCLRTLKKIGYHTGGGFMVGSPYQTYENLAEDILFLHELQPQMVGIGPFIPHHDSPFADFPAGTLRDTLLMLSLVRLTLPAVMLPATTALETIDKGGRAKGLMAGANVIMINISPDVTKGDYLLYNNKAGISQTLHESAQSVQAEIASTNMNIEVGVGNPITI